MFARVTATTFSTTAALILLLTSAFISPPPSSSLPPRQSRASAARRKTAPSPGNDSSPADNSARRPKLVVLLVVDQMRADYIDKFLPQWTSGLRRLVRQGAWFREAAYPYAATETCVGHATISTGSLPASHGMAANTWWDRESQKVFTCTEDPKVQNVGYA